MNEFTLNWLDWMFAAAWQTALVAVFVFLVLAIGKRYISAHFQHLLLLIVLVKFATPPFLHSPTGLFSQPVVAQLSTTEFKQPFFSGGAPFEVANVIESPLNQRPSLNDTSFQSVAKHESETLPTVNREISRETIGMRSMGSHAEGSRSYVPWTAWIFAVYGVGMLFFVTRFALQFFRLRKMVITSRKSSNKLVATLERIGEQLGLARIPELRVSNETDAPFVTGVLRPTIVLPSHLVSQLSTEQLRMVITHELLHLRNRDLWVGWIETWIYAVWWFHPAMWWLSRSLRQAREDRCDDYLLAAQLADPQIYCETIIEAARVQMISLACRTVASDTLAFEFARREHPAGRRIRRLMDHTIPRRETVRLSAVCFAVFVALAVLPGIRMAETHESSTDVTVRDETGASSDLDQEQASESVERITGRVIDERGRPIVGARVAARLTSQAKHSQHSKVLFEKETTTQKDGRFEFEVTQQADPDHKITFVAEVSSAHCFQRTFFQSGLEKSGQLAELESYQLNRGIRIKGRVVAPSSRADSPSDPIVSIVANYAQEKNSPETLYRYLKCDRQGDFDCVVPATCKLTIQVMAANFASNSLKLELAASARSGDGDIEERDLGKIKLKQGTSVYGTAKLRNGHPAAGVVLGMVEGDLDNPSDVSAVKTDDQGRFRFATHSGKCAILSLKACRTRKIKNGYQQALRSEKGFPLFGPRFLDLNSQGDELEVNLTESESVTLSGVIRNFEGQPIPGVTLRCGWFTDRGLVEVEWITTDEQGRYASRVPKGKTPSLVIQNQWLRGESHEPYDVLDKEFTQRQSSMNSSSRDRVRFHQFTGMIHPTCSRGWVTLPSGTS